MNLLEVKLKVLIILSVLKSVTCMLGSKLYIQTSVLLFLMLGMEVCKPYFCFTQLGPCWTAPIGGAKGSQESWRKRVAASCSCPTGPSTHILPSSDTSSGSTANSNLQFFQHSHCLTLNHWFRHYFFWNHFLSALVIITNNTDRFFLFFFSSPTWSLSEISRAVILSFISPPRNPDELGNLL